MEQKDKHNIFKEDTFSCPDDCSEQKAIDEHKETTSLIRLINKSIDFWKTIKRNK